MNKEQIRNKIEALKGSIGDNETMHGIYDEILWTIAAEHEPEIKAEMDEIVKGEDFWYA